MDERALKKVILDSGHSGTDSGTVANGIVEKDYNLKISDYIHKRLDEMGVPNKMTRTSDVTLTPYDLKQQLHHYHYHKKLCAFLGLSKNVGKVSSVLFS